MDGVVGELGAVAAAQGGREPEVLAERPDGVVVRSGRVVAKAHAADTDTAALTVRLRIAAHPLLHGVLLPPLPGTGPYEVSGRTVTLWPYGEPVDREDPDAAPWEQAAALLARLHRLPLDAFAGPVPPMRGPLKVGLAVDGLGSAGAVGAAVAPVVRKAAEGLPGWALGACAAPPSRTVVHGDLHLGQLVRCPDTGQWRLIDVDDLGTGDPAWDLARPAAWFAIGLLAPEVWWRFLSAYRAAGGPAVPADGDPWQALDVPARALTVQSAALAVTRAEREGRPLDGVDESLVAACARIAGIASGGVVS